MHDVSVRTGTGMAEPSSATYGSGIYRFTPVLITGVLVTIVLILAVILYGLLGGVINPPAPRTYPEYLLVRAQTMVGEEPGNGQYWADYVDIMILRGNYREAEDLIVQAREAVGDSATILLVNNAELRLLLAQGVYEEVLERGEAYLEQDAEMLKSQLADYAARGITVPSTFNKQRAAVTIETLLVRARAAVELKEYETALDDLNAALDWDPLAADIRIFRGNVGLLEGGAESLERAKEDFTFALQFLPDSDAARAGLAELERRLEEEVAP
ncbi:MAG: hypothetical protein RQ731_03335 [Anaerosomatales bacterium]|nr:hypothetical protein [Anaerosomatales bacterium]MDT8433775.1 hypothetical protein [Anaerosomatales bacterium]